MRAFPSPAVGHMQECREVLAKVRSCSAGSPASVLTEERHRIRVPWSLIQHRLQANAPPHKSSGVAAQACTNQAITAWIERQIA